MFAHRRDFKVCISSNHRQKEEAVNSKEELLGLVLDVLQSLPEEGRFELHILREEGEPEEEGGREDMALSGSYDLDLLQ